MKRVGIIGSGNVGANTAFFIAENRTAHVTLVDIREGLSTGKALDMMEAGPIRGYGSRLTGADDLAAISGHDVIVLAAGRVRKPGENRIDLYLENSKIVSAALRADPRARPVRRRHQCRRTRGLAHAARPGDAGVRPVQGAGCGRQPGRHAAPLPGGEGGGCIAARGERSRDRSAPPQHARASRTRSASRVSRPRSSSGRSAWTLSSRRCAGPATRSSTWRSTPLPTGPPARPRPVWSTPWSSTRGRSCPCPSGWRGSTASRVCAFPFRP